MSQTLQRDEQALEQQPMPSARHLMTLTPEEREPFLEAAVTSALPLYEADRRKSEAERELTADLETGLSVPSGQNDD